MAQQKKPPLKVTPSKPGPKPRYAFKADHPHGKRPNEPCNAKLPGLYPDNKPKEQDCPSCNRPKARFIAEGEPKLPKAASDAEMNEASEKADGEIKAEQAAVEKADEAEDDQG